MGRRRAGEEGKGGRREEGRREEGGTEGQAGKPYMQLLAPRLLLTCNYSPRGCCLHAITCWFCLPGQPRAAERRKEEEETALHAITCSAAVAYMQLLAPRLLPTCSYLLLLPRVMYFSCIFVRARLLENACFFDVPK